MHFATQCNRSLPTARQMIREERELQQQAAATKAQKDAANARLAREAAQRRAAEEERVREAARLAAEQRQALLQRAEDEARAQEAARERAAREAQALEAQALREALAASLEEARVRAMTVSEHQPDAQTRPVQRVDGDVVNAVASRPPLDIPSMPPSTFSDVGTYRSVVLTINVTKSPQQSWGIQVTDGAAGDAGLSVVNTVEGSPAYGALLPNDVLQTVNGHKLTSARELVADLANCGGDATFTVLRRTNKTGALS